MTELQFIPRMDLRWEMEQQAGPLGSAPQQTDLETKKIIRIQLFVKNTSLIGDEGAWWILLGVDNRVDAVRKIPPKELEWHSIVDMAVSMEVEKLDLYLVSQRWVGLDQTYSIHIPQC